MWYARRASVMVYYYNRKSLSLSSAVGVEQRLGLHESDTNGDDGGAMGDADTEPVIFALHHSQHLCAPCA